MEIKPKYQAQASPDDLDLIREQLYIGAYGDIANSTGYSEVFVKQVFQGIRRNNSIIEAARELIKSHQQTLEQIEVKYNRHNQ